MSDHREADIVINGVTLTFAQSMAVRVAVTSFLIDLPERLADLGPIGPLYQARLGEVQDLIVAPLATRPEPPPVRRYIRLVDDHDPPGGAPRAFCARCGAEVTWPMGQAEPWPCGHCADD